MKDEALKLALEALEGVLDDSPKVLEASISGGLYEVVQCRDAITAIKQALAAQPAPVQEPVAWMHKETGLLRQANKAKSGDFEPNHWTPLYTTPPAAQPAPVQPIIGSYLEKDNSQFKFSDYESDGVHHNKPAVPDAFGTREGEHPQYIQGWNDCRAEMLKGMKP